MRARPPVVGFLLALALVPPAQAGIPVPWVPANAGILWYQSGDPNYPISIPKQPPGASNGAWWLTRRLAAHPLLPGVMHLGSFLHGIYVSAGGGGWATLTPACILPPDKPASVPLTDAGYRTVRNAARAISGLDACAVEGIAYDPFDPLRVYVSAYDVVSLKGTEPTIGPGGVYVSGDGGVTWDKLIGGLRGNGLAVARTSPIGEATIVAGSIQQSNANVGSTPGNGSLVVSHDGGRNWSSISLPTSGCSDIVETSQRITPTIAFNPTDATEVYAGTNAGLYASSDGGDTWRLVRQACGGVWGIAVTANGSSIYIGDKDGVISKASTASLSFSPIADVDGATRTSKIQSLVLDPRDDKTLYASIWSGSTVGVYRVRGDAPPAERLDDSLLRDIVPLEDSWPSGVPRPFPLSMAPGGATPSLFLSTSPLAETLEAVPASPGPLWVSTVFHGVFVRGD